MSKAHQSPGFLPTLICLSVNMGTFHNLLKMRTDLFQEIRVLGNAICACQFTSHCFKQIR